MRSAITSLSVVIALVAYCFIPVQSNEEQDLIQPLIDWVVSKGGIFNDKLEIRKGDLGYNGMFAKNDIPENELLLEIPRHALFTAGVDDDNEYGELYCPTAFKLVEEWKLGDKSEFAPYTNYLKSQNAGELPSSWSIPGRALLLEFLAQTDKDVTNDLPPNYPVFYIDHNWFRCDNSRDPAGIRAALYLLQRGWDELMIPVYDMMSHRNGHYLNTMTLGTVHDDKPIRVYASRDIKAGEEIYTTYNYCEDCGNRDFGYGTPEIVRDYGFVEMFPQRWFFPLYDIAFELDEIEPGSEKLSLLWLEDEDPSVEAIWFMTTQLRRLDTFPLDADDVPEDELRVIRNYRDALTVALGAALQYACDEGDYKDADECTAALAYMECRRGGGVCHLPKPYDALGVKPDPLDYNALDYFTCDGYDGLVFMDMEVLDSLKSHYQEVDFHINPENDNVCFAINGVVQICGSYRPQYHEMVVHYTARYLDSINRVLFVGGGDSMLLHELLKYPNIEFVVGLELDQVITRYSFKHTGTQPHFDNEKVQWWYGDASKSLLMLPADYFGSFDMVLVDLSETVMSMSVTAELDILKALTLLLKPEGIFVKNELYMNQFSSMFRYALQIHYPEVPFVCSQCLVLGSNRVDFLNDELREHDLIDKNLYVKPLAAIEDRYEYFHDYRHNTTANILCKDSDWKEEEPTEQTRSPGILMVVEVENASAKLDDSKSVLGAIEKVLKKEGFHPVTQQQSKSGDRIAGSIIVQEGYVVARTWPEENYAAVDIHLWSSFDKHDIAKTAVVKALQGGKPPSAYRIVAGGMFGVSTWREDEKKRGPRPTDPCVKDPQPPHEKSLEKSVGETILEEGIDQLINAEHLVVAVLCGEKGESCNTEYSLKKHKGVAQVIPIWSCAGIEDMNEFEEGASERLVACETEMGNALMQSVSEDSKIRVFIVDPSASYTAGRIAFEILKTNDDRLFDSKLLAMSVILNENEDWRRNLMERIRTNIITFDPAFRAAILFNNTESTIEFGVTISEDDHFVRRLQDFAGSVEKKTGLDADVRLIIGGQYVHEEDWKWEFFFLPEDYNQKPPLKQYMSQKPLAYQVLSQLEKTDDLLELSTNSIKSALKYALAKTTSEAVELHASTDAGDGCVIVGFWSGGTVVVLWDGQSHMDLNWFTYQEDSDLSSQVVAHFMSSFPDESLMVALLDEQPRGTGRVVNFYEDVGALEGRERPHWAKFKV